MDKAMLFFLQFLGQCPHPHLPSTRGLQMTFQMLNTHTGSSKIRGFFACMFLCTYPTRTSTLQSKATLGKEPLGTMTSVMVTHGEDEHLVQEAAEQLWKEADFRDPMGVNRQTFL